MRKKQDAILLYASGLIVVDRAYVPSLENLQKFVGGFIDVINLEPSVIEALDNLFGVSLGRRACVVVHDEGLLVGLEFNQNASLIAQQMVVVSVAA